MRISDWSSDVCSSDLTLSKNDVTLPTPKFSGTAAVRAILPIHPLDGELAFNADLYHTSAYDAQFGNSLPGYNVVNSRLEQIGRAQSELQSLMRISYAVFCLKKKKTKQ